MSQSQELKRTVVEREADDGAPTLTSCAGVDAAPLAEPVSGEGAASVGAPGNPEEPESSAAGLCPGALPPRKRAKTKDEKEQRRVERIMRNRQAAHASREKKRRHVEELEARCERLTGTNAELEEKLRQVQKTQVHALEQHYALRARLERLEAAVALARSSGDVSCLDSDAASPAPVSLPAPPSPRADKSATSASPEALVLHGAAPSLSHSAANSPLALDDAAPEPFEQLAQMPFNLCDLGPLDSLSKTHHPAVMVL